ncbi:MAG: anhydro-N-acetylmuramic acid kinase [Bacteroidia bacterium]
MSGTSLDGLDICLAAFAENNGKAEYEILHAGTISYQPEHIQMLKKAETCSGAELMQLHHEYGVFLGKQVLHFLNEFPVKPDAIASHGHTIFHRPDAGYTFQLGSGASLAATSGITTICDFRSTDVALGGQGAPLVPAGDEWLFPDYDACLNIGGFANISFRENQTRIAFDICPVNYVLNALCKRIHKDFDDQGLTASSGKSIPALLEILNTLPFYELPYPKSLGREWTENNIFPLLEDHFPVQDLLRTFTEHAAMQIAKYIPESGKTLVTGGGAWNRFLIHRIESHTTGKLVIPDARLVNFKEALIFAFLGYLRLNDRINVLSSVTGALKDSCSGAVYQ